VWTTKPTGRILEKYILLQLSTAPAFKLFGREYGTTNEPDATAVSLADVRGVQVVRWYGKFPAELNKGKDMLL
jgi:hypothetical protein